jgi:hypothetical protein
MDEALIDEEAGEVLKVRYAPDSDGTGKLTVTAATGPFAGESSAWFDTTGLVEFAEGLSTYPCQTGNRCKFEAASEPTKRRDGRLRSTSPFPWSPSVDGGRSGYGFTSPHPCGQVRR